VINPQCRRGCPSLRKGGQANHRAFADFTPGGNALMLIGAEVCQTCANLQRSGLQFVAKNCALCAEICKACAASCKTIGERDGCAAACRKFAESGASLAPAWLACKKAPPD
jgi:hypothetical protein